MSTSLRNFFNFLLIFIVGHFYYITLLIKRKTNNINIFIKFDGNIIKDAYFDGEACAISTASTSIMLKEIIGKTKEEALAIIDNFNNMINEQDYDKDKMNESLAFDEMYKQESRKTCATLPYKALYKLVSK